MQVDGTPAEAAQGSGNEQLPETPPANSAPSNPVSQPALGGGQSHLRHNSSPDQMRQHQQVLPNAAASQGPTSNHVDSGGAAGGGGSVGGHHHQHHSNQRQRHQGTQNYPNHAPGYHQQHHPQHKYNNSRSDNDSNVNHVLLITVINPHYTITCDLIQQICSAYGKVNRVVIFKKNGVQAMVEFDNVESAKRAKTMLHGCDIYSGCCTLRIEYAKPTRLNIHKNDNDSFDYTIPPLGVAGDGEVDVPEPGQNTGEHLQPAHGHQVHQQQPTYHQGGQNHRSAPASGPNRRGGSNNSGNQFHPNRHHDSREHAKFQQQHDTSPDYGGGQPMEQQAGGPNGAFQQDGGFNVSRGGPPSAYVGVDSYMPSPGNPHNLHASGSYPPRHEAQQQQQQQQQQLAHHHHHPRPALGHSNHNPPFSASSTNNAALMAGPSNLAHQQGTVMMVYGLDTERLNCDRLFNLFCLYGNVVRVKFLRTKVGCAMVQMGDVISVDRCVSSLNKTLLFGNELQLSYSKQQFLHDAVQPFILPDGSLSFKDLMNNKNNRFKNPEVASKNRILPPSQVLHFFNAPYGITEEELVHLFKQTAGYEPVTLKIFTQKADNAKSFSGLVTFRNPTEATEALVLCNHLSMPKSGAPHPYILRLCFSPPPHPRPANTYL